MWIRELYATFGSLDNKQLSLKDGLNIVYGRNEAGKSTWSAFIRAMLYGISTREKAKAGYIPDKERYLPWNGSPMYGRAEIVSGGDEITIERTSGKTGVFTKAEAKNLTRGGDAPTGEELCGIAKGVYDRCAFIGQAKLGIDGDADTEKRILSLASSGEETVSVQEVLSRLEKKQREIRSPRGLGVLAETEREIQSLEAEISAAAEAEAALARTEESIREYEKKEAFLARAIKIAEAEESKKTREFICRSKEELIRARERARECENLPSRRDLEEFAEMRDTHRLLTSEENDARSRLTSAENALAYARRETEMSVFSGMSEAEAAQKAERDKAELAAIANRGKMTAAIAMMLAAAVLVTAAVALYFNKTAVIAAAIAAAGIACGAAGTVLLASVGKKKRRAEALGLTYGAADAEAVDRAFSSYLDAVRRANEAEARKKSAEAEMNAARQSALLRENELKAYLMRFGIDEKTLANGETRLRGKADLREKAYAAVREAEIRAETIERSAAAEAETIEYTEEEIPQESAERLRERSAETASVKKSLEMNAAAERARLAGFDGAGAKEKLLMLREREGELSFRFDAYSLAMKYIGEADGEMRSRFSPEVERRTSEIFSSLTGGSFEVVRIRSREFDMDVAAGVASARRDELSLSRGTLDELYFSLRLALCELILPEENAPPIVLDDVFVNFDDERTARALRLLRETAKKRQVILFSCHTREAKCFENDSEVNKIQLA